MTTIKLKNGSGAPAGGDLVQGEPALDLTNKRLYTEDSGGTVIEVGTNPGVDVTFADNRKAVFGAGSDLQIYHDGSNSYIDETATGHLFIRSNGDGIYLRSSTNEEIAHFNVNGSVKAYYDNSLKLATTSTGIDVTGVITTDGMTTSADINFGDDDKALFGAGNDLKIYHSANNQSYIHEAGSGDLNILASNFKVQNGAGTRNKIVANTDGAVTLYYDNAAKIATTSTGIDVTGNVLGDTFQVDAGGHIEFNFNGVSEHFTSGTNPHIFAGEGSTGTYLAGTLNFQSRPSFGRDINFITGTTPAKRLTVGSTGDISFYEDTGTTAKLFWDASAESLGIGTSLPQKPLHINSGTGNIGVRVESSDATASIEFMDNGTTSTALSPRVGGISDDFFVQTNGTEAMRIDSSGNVGIGTSSPDSLVHAYKANNAILKVAEADGYASLQQSGVNSYLNSVSSGGSLIFRNGTAPTERMRIDASGNFLVGTTDTTVYNNSADSTADNGFQVNPAGWMAISAYQQTCAFINRTGNDGSLISFTRSGSEVGSIASRSGAVTTMVFDPRSNGSGISGTTNGLLPTNEAGTPTNDHVDLGSNTNRFKDLYLSGGINLGGPSEINASIAYLRSSSTNTSSLTLRKAISSADAVDYVQCRNDANTLKLVIEGSGDIKNTNNSYGAISDEKLKENIVDATSQWDDIKAVRVRKYSLKEDGLDAPNMLGVVAQELESAGMNGLVSESVDRNENNANLGTVTKSVNYSILYMKAVKALQEAMVRIESLEAEVSALKGD